MLMDKMINENELDKVNGGMGAEAKNGKTQIMPMQCPFCDCLFNADVSLPFVICPKEAGGCGEKIELKG